MKNIKWLFGTAIIFMAFAVAPPAFAAGGWYLLVPPTSDYDEHAEYLQGYKILDTKPLSQWAQQGAYDSASECEAVKDSLVRVEHNFYSKSSMDYIKAIGTKEAPAALKLMKWTSERSNANVDALSTARCIKSDDPRLGK